MSVLFRKNETVWVRRHGTATVISPGYVAGDAVVVEFPNGWQAAFLPRDLEKSITDEPEHAERESNQAS